MKKKQPDFQKTKLRVGKSKLLPRGKNVTNTAFKSKKIVTQTQKFKISADDVNLKELLSLAVHSNVPIKREGLKKIGKYVEKHIGNLKSYFFNILNTVGKVLLDSDGSIRKEAIELVEKCLESLTAAQIDSFMETLTSQLSCMMTHVSLSVKKDSLHLLSVLLKSAPSSVCYSRKVLPNLLDMISSRNPKKKTTSIPRIRKLEDNISSSMTALEWRDHVMKLILELLQSLVDSDSPKKPIFQDEQRVYLDPKKINYVPLYAGGGLSPKKVEFPSSLLIKSKMEIAETLRSFVGDLVKVSSDIITEEMALKAHKKFLPSEETIEHLNTITQVLCCLGQWYKIQGSQLDDDFLIMMHEMINKKLMVAFPYALNENVSRRPGKKSLEMICLHLNLGISYLFSIFILGTEFSHPGKEKKIIICLLDAMGYGFTLDAKCVLLVLDSLKVLIHDMSICNGTEENKYKQEISEIFDALNDFLINSKDEDLKIEVQRFFVEIVLNFDYQIFLEYKGIKNWINFTFGQIKHMKSEKKIDNITLKCINQMCAREYPAFMSNLNKSNPLEILEYLKFENEDFQFTIMNLITHMTQLPKNFLQDVANFILCENSLSVKTIGKFIWQLCIRFSEDLVPEVEAQEFIKFLLNVAFDIVSVERTSIEVEALNQNMIQDSRTIKEEDMTDNSQQCDADEVINQHMDLSEENDLKNLLLDVQDLCHFQILPSLKWKRHSDILNVCLECLLSYKDRNAVANYTAVFLNELKNYKIAVPAHSAIALIEISTKVYHYIDCDFRCGISEAILDELLFASLFYISILTDKVPDDTKLKEYCVPSLQNALCLSKKKMTYIFKLLVSKLYREGQGVDETTCLYSLRILKFFFVRQYINASFIVKNQELLHILKPSCAEGTLENVYLMDIYHYMQSQT